MSRNRQIDDYRRMMAADNTDGTIRNYVLWIERFEEWRDRMHFPRLSRGILVTFDEFLCDADEIRELMESVDGHSAWNQARPNGEGFSYPTRIKAISADKSWMEFKYEYEFDSRKENQVHNIVSGDSPAFDPIIAEPPTVKEIFDDCERCSADSCHAMARLGYDAIMRCCELVRVRFDDYDANTGRVYVRAAKGSKNRHIELADSTVDVLDDYRELVMDRFDDPEWLFYMFQNYHFNKPWKSHGWSQHFVAQHWEPGFHAFARHSAITNRLNAGQELTKVSQRARHRNMSTTQQYIQFVGNDADSIPPELR